MLQYIFFIRSSKIIISFQSGITNAVNDILWTKYAANHILLYQFIEIEMFKKTANIN